LQKKKPQKTLNHTNPKNHTSFSSLPRQPLTAPVKKIQREQGRPEASFSLLTKAGRPPASLSNPISNHLLQAAAPLENKTITEHPPPLLSAKTNQTSLPSQISLHRSPIFLSPLSRFHSLHRPLTASPTAASRGLGKANRRETPTDPAAPSTLPRPATNSNGEAAPQNRPPPSHTAAGTSTTGNGNTAPPTDQQPSFLLPMTRSGEGDKNLQKNRSAAKQI